MKVVSARTESICAGCRDRIRIGDRIVKPSDHGWTHVRCACSLIKRSPGNEEAGYGPELPVGLSQGSALRARSDADHSPREARTHAPRNYDSPTSLEDAPVQDSSLTPRSHTRWTEVDVDVLAAYVEKRYSAEAIGIKLKRSTIAIQSKIAKQYGDRSDEAVLYGSYRVPGELAAWLPGRDPYLFPRSGFLHPVYWTKSGLVDEYLAPVAW